MNSSSDNNLSSLPTRDLFGELVTRLVTLPDIVAATQQGVQSMATQLNDLRAPQRATEEPRPAERSKHDSSAEDGELLFRMHQCLERLAQEQCRLGEQHYLTHVIEPLAQRLAMVYDVALEASKAAHAADCGPGSSSLVLSALASMVLELLACYGVRPLDALPGSAFDIGTMSAQSPPPHNQEDGVWQVAESVRLGFIFSSGRVLRPQTVTVKRAVQNGCTETSECRPY